MTEVGRLLKNRRVLAGLILVGLLLSLALWPKAIESDVSRVVKGPLEVTLDEEGMTRVRHRFVVSAPVSGHLLRISLEPGDPVEKGVVLATILPGLPTPLDARSRAESEAAVSGAKAILERARAEEERAKAAANLARLQLTRYRELAASGLATKEALEARETEARTGEEAVRAASFSVATAAHQLDAAKARLLQTSSAEPGKPVEVRSPVAGAVLKKARESEANIPAGEPLLEIGDPANLEIVADFLSADAVRIPVGAEARIEQWGAGKPLRARVRRVEPSGFTKISALGVEEQRVNVVLDFVDPPAMWKSLGDGYRVEVRVVTGERNAALKVASAALFRRGSSWCAFVVERGRVRLRTVEIGLRNALETEVISGLSEREEVVVHPSDLLSDGARISRRKQ